MLDSPARWAICANDARPYPSSAMVVDRGRHDLRPPGRLGEGPLAGLPADRLLCLHKLIIAQMSKSSGGARRLTLTARLALWAARQRKVSNSILFSRQTQAAVVAGRSTTYI